MRPSINRDVSVPPFPFLAATPGRTPLYPLRTGVRCSLSENRRSRPYYTASPSLSKFKLRGLIIMFEPSRRSPELLCSLLTSVIPSNRVGELTSSRLSTILALWHNDSSPRIRCAHFPAYARRIYVRTFRTGIGRASFYALLIQVPPPLIRFLNARASLLLTASFRFHLAMDTLAVRLTTVGFARDFHSLVNTPCRAYTKKALPIAWQRHKS